MGLRCGIVGLPNAGKSTLFNAITSADIAADSYPFCTIDPNSGIVPVPDHRLDQINRIAVADRVVAATIELVDIAGLVRGASRGEGLGNQFLGHIRETHALIHVVRCFEDPDVAHIDGKIDPIRDVETVETELLLADLQTVEKQLERSRKLSKSEGAAGEAARCNTEFLDSLCQHLSEGRNAREFQVSEAFEKLFNSCHLLTAKPVLYVANVDDLESQNGDNYTFLVERHAAKFQAGCLKLSASIEAELLEIETEERRLFLEDLGIKEPGLHQLLRSAYALLKLITVFTQGPKEVRAWTVRQGTRAAQAAGEIHSDFERNFIRAEVINFQDFVTHEGEAGAKAAGLLRVEGRDYVVRDGDIVHYRVGA